MFQATSGSAAALLLILVGACHGPRAQVSNLTTPLPAQGLTNRQPADIAVAPVRNQSDNDQVPVDLVREAIYEELAQRLYSPLDLGYVDGHWIESAFAGEAPPDAVLMISITDWSAARLYSSGILNVSAELRLFAGGSAEGDPLWGVAVNRTIELGDPNRRPLGPASEFLPRAVTLFAKEALNELPERDAVAAPR